MTYKKKYVLYMGALSVGAKHEKDSRGVPPETGLLANFKFTHCSKNTLNFLSLIAVWF